MNRLHVQMRIRWHVRPEQADAVTAAAQSLLTATRREPGCLTCSLTTEVGTQARVSLEEVWENERSLRRHVQSARFGVLASLIEAALEEPLVRFDLPDGRRGLDYVHEARGERAGSID